MMVYVFNIYDDDHMTITLIMPVACTHEPLIHSPVHQSYPGIQYSWRNGSVAV